MSGDVRVSGEYQEHLLSSLYAMYEQQQHCDLELQLDQGQSVFAHKAILMAGSTYLRALVENSPDGNSNICVGKSMCVFSL